MPASMRGRIRHVMLLSAFIEMAQSHAASATSLHKFYSAFSASSGDAEARCHRLARHCRSEGASRMEDAAGSGAGTRVACEKVAVWGEIVIEAKRAEW